ncbi:MAG: hypothetical protein IKL22_12065 [Lachnospiraceae bacterium]|nr:hypothetical protein [Lachnospiraceae bacterium]
MKKIIWLLIGVVCIFWCTRIYWVNQEKREIELYHMGEMISYEPLIVTATEACLLDSRSFEERFKVATDTIPGLEADKSSYQIIGVCLLLENNGKNLITWEEIERSIGVGFEAVVWRNGMDPYLGSAINQNKGEGIGPGMAQEIWYMTTINRSSFKENSWLHHEEQTFYFVTSLYPHKKWIELKLGKE